MVYSDDIGNEKITEVADIINGNVDNMNMHSVLGYVSYFVLGYYLNKTEINKKIRAVIYVLGIVGLVMTAGLSYVFSIRSNSYCTGYYEYITVNVLMTSIAVFVWFKYRKYNYEKMNKLIKVLSKYSFGAYLVHALVIEQMDALFGINTLSYNSALAVVVNTLVVAVVSFGISAILNQIPIVKKVMV